MFKMIIKSVSVHTTVQHNLFETVHDLLAVFIGLDGMIGWKFHVMETKFLGFTVILRR